MLISKISIKAKNPLYLLYFPVLIKNSNFVAFILSKLIFVFGK